MMVEVRVQSLGLDRGNNPVVVLEELEGPRVLPIWIGPAEASAIATQLAGAVLSRPFTHDLLVSVLKGLEGSVDRVVIDRVEQGTYYAELIVARPTGMVSIDARPSDSIAIALRTNARIFAHDSLLEERESEDATAVEAAEPSVAPPAGMDAEELQKHLKRLNPEDFGRFTP